MSTRAVVLKEVMDKCCLVFFLAINHQLFDVIRYYVDTHAYASNQSGQLFPI